MGGGGHVKFYPYKKGGGQKKILPCWRGGGHNKFWGSFYAVGWIAILVGARKKFPLFKRGGGGAKSFTLSWGGRANSFEPSIFPFCSPTPISVINDQSLPAICGGLIHTVVLYAHHIGSSYLWSHHVIRHLGRLSSFTTIWMYSWKFPISNCSNQKNRVILSLSNLTSMQKVAKHHVCKFGRK